VRLTHQRPAGDAGAPPGGDHQRVFLAAFIPPGAGSLYGFTKAFLNDFSEGLYNDLRGSGVRIQALCPGFTYTEFHDRPVSNTSNAPPCHASPG